MPEGSSYQVRYLKSVLRRRRLVTTTRLLLAVAFFILWETAADLGWIDSFFFSSPSRIGKAFLRMLEDGSLFLHIGTTLAETLVSFALVVILGVLTAVLLWLSRPSRRFWSLIW